MLYADDLVLISTSPTGLQHSINRLQKYCKKWKLNVNLSKSKVMCLQNNNKYRDNLHITFNNIPLQEVYKYTYLGFELSTNLSLKVMENSIMEKAKKALFKLKSLIYGSNIKPKSCLQMFDQLIKPICLYGSEI